MPSLISTSKLQELFECKNGSLFWKITFNKVKAGDEAGCKLSTGYRAVRINGERHQAHRLIYQMHYGEIPLGMIIDHINCNRADNRIDNLRLCTYTQNVQNKSLNKNNKSGSKNVYWSQQEGKWGVGIRINKSKKHFGFFKDLELADLVAMEARNKFHGQFANHGTQRNSQ